MRRLTVLGLLLTFCSSAGCLFGDTATTPTDYTIVAPVTEIFSETLEVQGSKSFSFIVNNPDPLRITLASMTNPSTGASVSANVQLSIGIINSASETCTAIYQANTTSSLVAQYLQVVTAGSYCVVVTDTGGLTSPVKFAVRIIHS